MVRMSDILKKVEQRKLEGETAAAGDQGPATQDPPAAQPASPQTSSPVSPPPKQDTPKKETPQPAAPTPTSVPKPAPGMRMARQAAAQSAGLNNDDAIQLYQEALSLVKNIYDRARDDQAVEDEDKKVISQVEQFVDQQLLDNDNIVGLISLPTKKDYIYNHAVNTCIIAIEVGIGFGYNRDELIDLGTAAIFSDIGMVKFSDLYNQPRKLTDEEKERIQEHTSASFEILQKFKHINKRVSTVSYQLHERQDGTGYPCGLKGDSIDEYVKIIGVADIYDAAIHPRPYRDAMQPYEALNLVIQSKDSLGAKGVRIFIERLSCPYPIGCYVKLSSGEKGMVVGRNLGSSFRPIVEIMCNINRDSPEMTRLIDLKKAPTIYIKDYLTKDEIEQLM